ncbi:MAG: HlyD family efflux transporter periplasmic adaptor subunit [Chitinophagaceae bacterium]
MKATTLHLQRELFILSISLLLLFIFLSSCKNDLRNFDASGSFEAVEVIVSAEQSGKILQLNIEEGQVLDSNSVIGQIDVTALHIQKEQSTAALKSISQKVSDAAPQVAILQSQIKTQRAQVEKLNQQLAILNREITRTQNLVNEDAATQKQLDDLMGQKLILQIEIVAAQELMGVSNQQIISTRKNVNIQNKGILSEVNPSQKKIAIIDEQISRGKIINSFAGTVLTKYAMAGEYTSIAKPLYKIADLSVITLRAYITGNQLPLVKLNQKVHVHTDDGKGGYNQTKGVITWINDKAEFTPKTIQTKDERANLVYAMKVKVLNNGSYKIGMYGEINFK